MNSHNARPLPWRDQMRRAAEPRTQEIAWLAPPEVIALTSAHYLHAIRWLYECERLYIPNLLLSGATQVTTDDYFHTLRQQISERVSAPTVYGVLRADHRVEVCGFNAAGDVCHLIDHQTDRRMATYHRTTHERLHTQNLGAGALVFRLRYVAQHERWKISRFIQTLPDHYIATRDDKLTFERLQQYPFIGRDA